MDIRQFYQEHLKAILASPTVRQIGVILFGIIAILIVVRMLRNAAQKYIKDTGIRYRAQKSVVFIGYLVSFGFIFSTLSGRLSGITVTIGAVSAGITFALQEVIVSIAGWLAIAAGNFYKVGDRIQLGGIQGDVIDIGIVRTTLMECGGWVKADQYNGRIVRIANSFVFKEPVYNYSGDFPFLWDEIQVPIKFGSDRKLARSILQSVAQEVVGEYTEASKKTWADMVKSYNIEPANTEPMVTLIANDNWLEFTLRYVTDFKCRRSTKDQLFTRILDEIDKTEDKVAMASMTVQLVETPVIDVRLSNRS
jgi:small-conductance mechanosensitive channel